MASLEDGMWRIWRMGHGESGGWDMENLEDGIWRVWRMGYGESGGWDMVNLQDGIWRIGYGEEEEREEEGMADHVLN